MSDDEAPVVSNEVDHTEEELSTVSKLAHEVKNPLHAMLGITELMCDETDTSMTIEDARNWSNILHDTTRGLLITLERVLDREISGNVRVVKQDVHFSNVGQSIINLYSQEAKNKGVTLKLEIDNSFPSIHTDPVLLTEILHNLVSNSLKFTPRGGSITVKGQIDTDSNALIIVLQDTGVGIPAHILLAIQQGRRITTSENTSNRKGWGVGMLTILENTNSLDCEFLLHCPEAGGTVATLRFPE